MIKVTRSIVLLLACCALLALPALAQTTGSIAGTISDEKGAVIPGATVTVRNIATNETRTARTDDDGRYRVSNMSVGEYEISVEGSGFAKHVRTGVSLVLNQAAVVDVEMKTAGVQEVVNVTENASLLNTTTAEVSTRFDSRRLSELPLSTTRSIYNVALSAPGISQVVTGQSQSSLEQE